MEKIRLLGTGIIICLLTMFVSSVNAQKYKSVFKIYAFRFKFQVGYCIVTDHIDKLSFSDVGVNLKRAYLAINLFKSDKYVPTNNPPILPLCIKEPVSKRKVFIR